MSLQCFSRKLIPLSSGVLLEADLSVPPTNQDEEGNRLAVCLHPWSWLGGSKDDPTLHILAACFEDCGYHVLRFNSRGVGKSTGRASFTGFSEAQDLRDIVKWGIDTVPDIRHVVILGYSHGSLIASLHPSLPPPVQIHHILLSYPLGPRSWLTAFRSSTYASALSDLIADPSSDILVIYGDRDEFTGIASYQTWAEELKRQAAGAGKGKLQVQRIDGGSHFWFHQAEIQSSLQQVVRAWLPR
ncbi:hypothetical protein JAAARDRAFT_131498 [Jaapia argillacea MUCL 33604]|uniref:AB hydrolase-1 domain-containing protein n=1 Tax=Jaapia argillacea MUCL 33604 TaxID=933084 RepID=A0A067Q327_9AGAM|nr:hypothetical protein JAAARDRAFT_131498 [Jaapia argillacea MUCL 33604]